MRIVMCKTDCAYVKMAVAGRGAIDLTGVGNTVEPL